MNDLLPENYLRRPFAHRGLHDASNRRPENSLAAAQAAIEHGYGIELDVQTTADAQAVVYHDYALERLTGETGEVRQRTMSELGDFRLAGGVERVPSLVEFLEFVAGRVPLLLDIKDQDGALGRHVGPLERAVAAAIDDFDGDVAVMSFNPHSVALMKDLAPDRPRGLVTSAFLRARWPVAKAVRSRLRKIPDYDRTGAVFISHQASDLDRTRVPQLKAAGASVICWTVRSPEEELAARKVADNVTFEGYLA